MTRRLWALTAWATLLALGHHVDHLLRGHTGWPLTSEVNPFTLSLLVYPAIALGVVLTLRRVVGPRFWAALAGGGAIFVLAVHLGAGGDSIAAIPDAYGSPVLGLAAVVELVLFIAVLIVTAASELEAARKTDRAPFDGRRARVRAGHDGQARQTPLDQPP